MIDQVRQLTASAARHSATGLKFAGEFMQNFSQKLTQQCDNASCSAQNNVQQEKNNFEQKVNVQNSNQQHAHAQKHHQNKHH